MALMDAGIPLRAHVAGVSVGLVSEVDPSTGTTKDYRILTDILGLEDHLGDMDFKIAGTRKGITAIQLDIKPAGIPLDIICESLEPASKGRLQILDHMEREINTPRAQDDRNCPRLVNLRFSNDALRRLIGPVGVLKRKIEEETGARISVGDGTLTIVAKNQSVMEKVQEKVDFIVGREIEIGGIYKGIVSSVKEYGAFVEFNGGQQGLLHISELSHEPVSRVSDAVSVGQQLSLMCIGQDVRGNIKLSLKATVPRSGSVTNNVVEGSVSRMKEGSNVWASIGVVSNEQDKQKSILEELPVSKNETSWINPSASSPPSILIRSAAECDEEEKSSGLNQGSKSTTMPLGAPKSDTRPKTSAPQNDLLDSPFSNSSLFSSANVKKSKHFTILRSQNEDEVTNSSESCSHSQNDLNNKKNVVKPHVSTRTLKLGMKATATVNQIRAHGLVLDLGGGIRGMYRFETGEKRDFVVGDELQVECSSFTSKGIPVMSLVEDD